MPDKPPNPTQPNASLVMGAAEYAVERARELAGSRLRTKLKANGECMRLIDGLPNALVAAALGSDRCVEVGDSLDLVRGAGGGLAAVLRRRGVDEKLAREMGVMVESHAALTLFEEEPGPIPSPDWHAVRR